MEPGDHMTCEELERIRRSSINPSNIFSRAYGNLKDYQVHAASAAHHTPIANGPGHNSAPPTAHPHCPTGHLRKDQSPSCSPHTLISVQLKLKLLNAQVQDVARVRNAVARGDVINTMKDNFQRTRVSEEVRTEGKLGEKTLVLDVEGTWRELTGVVGKLAAKHLKSHWEDLSKQIEVHARDEILYFKNTVNGMITSVGGGSHSSHFRSRKSRQTWRSSTCIGRGRGVIEFGSERSIECVPPSQIKRSRYPSRGEMSTLKGTVNVMLDQLSAFPSEATRIALKVGMQSMLGGQARVEGVQGTWVDLTRNVSKNTSNLADQVTLGSSSMLMFEEMLDLKMTINSMVAQLGALANKVTRVSLEVGMEGILGG
ncbi:hypothetical protein BYT27DRAFT_7252774 [Phlegmacium glaucopus]|nr:hypothetical protein BYT27DRAFT_7252774 [Phlegmacium glaucopus]